VVSRFSPNKRIDHAVHLLRLLTARAIDAHLTLVGGGMEEVRLRRLVGDLGLQQRVHFPGLLPEAEKNRRLQQSHFLVHTSIREGWGLNVTEANALGTPAIVYPVAGLIDSTVHQETGWVTPAETPESAVECLAALVREPGLYSRVRRQAWERAQTFHWDRVLPRACEWLEAQARGSP
jgi:glycosyltransferase involved in cell wall biosynthesis